MKEQLENSDGDWKQGPNMSSRICWRLHLVEHIFKSSLPPITSTGLSISLTERRAEELTALEKQFVERLLEVSQCSQS